MPYNFRKQGSKVCVFNTSTGENKGCSDTKREARAHMRAMYAAESGAKMGKKEIDDLIDQAWADMLADLGPDDLKELTEMETKEIAYVPYGVTTWDQLDAVEAAQETQEGVTELMQQYYQMMSNVFSDNMIDDKAAALKGLTDEFYTRLEAVMSGEEDGGAGDGGDQMGKELDEKAVWTTAYMNGLPDSAFLYIESGGSKDGEGKTVPRSKRHFPYKDATGKVDVAHVRDAIGRIPQSTFGLSPAQKKTLQNRARKILADNQKETGLIETVITRLKELLGFSPALETKEMDQSGIMLWKEADGTYRWVARYSNNFRDEDRPPEILAAIAHRSFVKGVDAGEFELPELWLWHIKEYKWGQADWVALDEAKNGIVFVVAGGHVTPGFEDLAEQISQLDPKEIRVSHGMPFGSIVRDPQDESIIVNYQTKEISPLPTKAAANKFTGFVILSKEVEMTIPQQKKDVLKSQWNLPDSILERLEAANVQDADKGISAGLETKEQPEPAPEVTTPAVTPPADASETKDEQAALAPGATEEKPLTRQEIVDAMGVLAEQINAAISGLTAKLEALTGEVKELQQTDEDKLHKAVSGLPPASLTDLFLQRSAIGTDEARVDGRRSLAQQKPKETEAPKDSITGFSFIDDILAGK